MTNEMKADNMYSLDLPSIINSRTTWSINKLLATKLSINPFFTAGDVFKSLSDADLDFLVKELDQVETNEHAMAELFLMALLIATGEGLDINGKDGEDIDPMMQYFNTLLTFVPLVSLDRKGLAEVMYENLSLGVDTNSLAIAKPTEAGIKFFSDLNGNQQ
jgi:hypothetical protein